MEVSLACECFNPNQSQSTRKIIKAGGLGTTELNGREDALKLKRSGVPMSWGRAHYVIAGDEVLSKPDLRVMYRTIPPPGISLAGTRG